MCSKAGLRMQGGASQSGRDSIPEATRMPGGVGIPAAGLCRGLVVGQRAGLRIGTDDGNPMSLEVRSHQGTKTASPPVGVRVVDDKITAVCKIGKTKLDLFRVHQQEVMPEGGKPPG
jgi:hypothetical protein